MQLGFYFDQTRCTGCFTCAVACKDWHGTPPGGANWLGVSCKEEGVFPNLFLAYLIRPCWHCEKPACVEACPMRALDAGPLEELIMKYGDNREAAGFVYLSEVDPSVRFKGKKKPLDIKSD
jgi:anaerobic dimethyl sulfoxide reductase subunit B (iron-sulfur subunit)